jgi:hypothetical protein
MSYGYKKTPMYNSLRMNELRFRVFFTFLVIEKHLFFFRHLTNAHVGKIGLEPMTSKL